MREGPATLLPRLRDENSPQMDVKETFDQRSSLDYFEREKYLPRFERRCRAIIALFILIINSIVKFRDENVSVKMLKRSCSVANARLTFRTTITRIVRNGGNSFRQNLYSAPCFHRLNMYVLYMKLYLCTLCKI